MMNTYFYSKDGIRVAVILDNRRATKTGGFPVKIRVSYQRKRTYYSTGKILSQEEWDRLDTTRLHSLLDIRKDIENSFTLVKSAVQDLSSEGEFSLEKLNDYLNSSAALSVNQFISDKLQHLLHEESIGTMLIYRDLLRSITRFAGDSIKFEDITTGWLKRYEAFMRSNGNKQTTIAINMRMFKAVCNDAIRQRVLKESAYPFGKGKYEIQEGSGRKKALTLEQIGQIARYDNGNPLTSKYRDYWLFLYLCNGINVADFVKLRFSDVIEGEICFIRQKTKHTSKVQKEIRALITPEMQRIIDNRGNIPNPTNYIFPILNASDDVVTIKEKTKGITSCINRYMKQIGEELGIGAISTYTARHSFATVLKRAGVNLSYISESLGHTDLRTTEHYLASFEKKERAKNSALLTQF